MKQKSIKKTKYPNIVYDFKNSKFLNSVNDIHQRELLIGGIFSKIIKAEKKFKCFRDPIGIKKLFYGKSKNEKKILFSENYIRLLKKCNPSSIRSVPAGSYQEINLTGKIIKIFTMLQIMIVY